jgi:periplasmic protein TonB
MNKFIITISFILVLLLHLSIINFFKLNVTEYNQQIPNEIMMLQLSKIETKKEVQKEEVVRKKEIEKPKSETKNIKKEPVKSILNQTIAKEEFVEYKEEKKAQETEKPQENINNENQIIKENLFIKNYISQLREEINKNKVYPTISRKLKEQGKVIISFRVLKNGVFENINIQTSSNIKRLDEAALNALYDTKKFRSFDEEITKDYMDFEVPLEFIVLN